MTIHRWGTHVKDIVFEPDKIAIGGRLRLLRDTLGLKQRDLARKLGDSYEGAFISKLETGQVGLSLAMAGHICEVTGESLDWLILGRGSPLVAKLPPLESGDTGAPRPEPPNPG